MYKLLQIMPEYPFQKCVGVGLVFIGNGNFVKRLFFATIVCLAMSVHQ